MEISQGANVLITTCRHQNAAVNAKNIRKKYANHSLFNSDGAVPWHKFCRKIILNRIVVKYKQ
jgi:hypothetical protein